MPKFIESERLLEPHLPGEPGVWVFIIGDLFMFSMLFAVFVYYRSADVVLFADSQRSLNQTLGAFNTVLMLSSSWLVASAVHAARRSSFAESGRLLIGALLCGAGFLVVKYFEWGEKIRAGQTIETNDFFMYYYLMTGIHLLHVIIGMGVLSFLIAVVRSGRLSDKNFNALESGASFWHLVDMLWIALFALLYLMR